MTTQPFLPAAAVEPWWRGVTRYQWLVLAIASAGWIFDVFEGQIFGSCMNEALPDLLRESGLAERKELFVNVGLAAFLAGGALGGVLFGMVADRCGRRRTMAVTILVYSAFTGLTALAQNWWHLAGLRFLVGMGVGGEWAVAAAAVAEVFPPHARPLASGIFHASSVLGTFLAVAAGVFVVAADPRHGWRYGFLLGVLPALLVFWVRLTMREPESWQAARAAAAQDRTCRLGRFADLFSTAKLCRHTLLGTALAIIGLATFWGTHFRGKDLLRQARARSLQVESGALAGWTGSTQREAQGTDFAPLRSSRSKAPAAPASPTPGWREQLLLTDLKRYEMLGMFLVTAGGGLGLLAFAPISQRVGRRPAFLLFHLGGFALVLAACWLAQSLGWLLVVLPVFGFFTLGMHAGYAIYFPELFPTRLRGTGAGFCFNTARVVAGPVLLGFGFFAGRTLAFDAAASDAATGLSVPGWGMPGTPGTGNSRAAAARMTADRRADVSRACARRPTRSVGGAAPARWGGMTKEDLW